MTIDSLEAILNLSVTITTRAHMLSKKLLLNNLYLYSQERTNLSIEIAPILMLIDKIRGKKGACLKETLVVNSLLRAHSKISSSTSKESTGTML